MIRKIIHIDEQKCNGCGLCVTACHEGAIGLEGGKARLLRDDYCDGLGDCLPACPAQAISFEEREAAPYDEAAVKANMLQSEKASPPTCPGSRVRELRPMHHPENIPDCGHKAIPEKCLSGPTGEQTGGQSSALAQWPVQIRLVPADAPYLEGAHLLIAADCAAYAYGGFHQDFMRNRVTLIGCPKLDETDYAEKLTAMLSARNVSSVTLARMEVPCCGGLEKALERALTRCGKSIPWRVVTITTDGKILETSPRAV